MSEIKNQDHILEAIDQLRGRKARPDADRICSFLLRRFNVESKDTKEDLKRLVETKTVIKVEYKGSTSYRNAAKWVKVSKEKNNDFSSIICGALSELIVHEPDYLDDGVPPNELEKYTIEKNKELFAKKNLSAIIKREIKSGNLVQLENGNYSLVEDQQSSSLSPQNQNTNTEEIVVEMVATSRTPSLDSNSTESTKKEKQTPKRPNAKRAKILRESRKSKSSNLENETIVESSSNDSTKKDTDDSENATSSAASGVNRPETRRKRAAKKVFDPSDNNVPKKKRGRPLGSKNKESREVKERDEEEAHQDTSGLKGHCYVCQSHSMINRLGQHETLIACRDCTTKAHPICVARYEKQHTSPWQCYQCKTCCVCSETDEYETMLLCRVCDSAYHMSCHIPPIGNKFKGPFQCFRCIQTKHKVEIKQEPMPMDSVSRSTPSPPSSVSSPSLSSPIPNSSSGISSLAEDAVDEENVPDASSWSVLQVASYLRHRGYHIQAKVFEDNEIDGQALLLMKRSDVVTGLHMKLGPALKAYKQVKRLQVRSSDVTLLWA